VTRVRTRIAAVVVASVLGFACAENASRAGRSEAPVEAPRLVAPEGAPASGHDEATAPLRRETVTAEDGHPLAVWSRAPTGAPKATMLLVHGRTWSSRPDFDLSVPGEEASTLALLADQGIAAYAVDLRGYGATPRDATGWLTPDRAASDLRAVLLWIEAQHPELPRPALLGWSMGALCAHLLAQREPARVSAVILYGYPRAAGHVHPPGPPSTSPPQQRPTTAAMAREDFIVAGAASDAVIASFAESAVQTDPIRMDWRALDEFNVLDAAHLRVPTLFIHGEHDPYAPSANQAALFSRMSDVLRAWVILPRADHAAHLERSKHAFVGAVAGFVFDAIAPDPSEGADE